MDQKEKANSTTATKVQNNVAPQDNNETPEALLTDVILENIFKYLSFKDLKSCRDVKNVIWLRSSKNAWCSKAKVVLNYCKNGDQNLQEILNQPEINSNAINYKLSHFKGEYRGLWETFGQSMKYLELHRCCLSSIDAFRQLIYIQCPNLEKLVMTFISFVKKPDQGIVEPVKWEKPRFGEQKNLKFLSISFGVSSVGHISLMEILSHFPNLQALECYVYEDVFKIISIIRKNDPTKLNLHHIDIRVTEINSHWCEERSTYYERYMSNEVCEESLRLVFMDPKLSFETIKFRVDRCETESLVDVLDAHSNTLKHFTLLLDYDNEGPLHIIPRQPLNMLEELKLYGNISPVDILNYTPNVKKISFNPSAAQNFVNSIDRKIRIESCKEFKKTVGLKTHEMADSEFAILVNAFPNVEKLDIDDLSNSNFAMICERWTKLVSLKVSFADHDADNRDNTIFFQSPPAGGMDAFLVRNWRSSLSKRTEKLDYVLKELEKLANLKNFKWKYFPMSTSGRNFSINILKT